MKVKFLRQFYKDLDKLTLQSVKNDIADTVENVERAAKPGEIKSLKKLAG